MEKQEVNRKRPAQDDGNRAEPRRVPYFANYLQTPRPPVPALPVQPAPAALNVEEAEPVVNQSKEDEEDDEESVGEEEGSVEGEEESADEDESIEGEEEGEMIELDELSEDGDDDVHFVENGRAVVTGNEEADGQSEVPEPAEQPGRRQEAQNIPPQAGTQQNAPQNAQENVFQTEVQQSSPRPQDNQRTEELNRDVTAGNVGGQAPEPTKQPETVRKIWWGSSPPTAAQKNAPQPQLQQKAAQLENVQQPVLQPEQTQQDRPKEAGQIAEKPVGPDPLCWTKSRLPKFSKPFLDSDTTFHGICRSACCKSKKKKYRNFCFHLQSSVLALSSTKCFKWIERKKELGQTDFKFKFKTTRCELIYYAVLLLYGLEKHKSFNLPNNEDFAKDLYWHLDEFRMLPGMLYLKKRILEDFSKSFALEMSLACGWTDNIEELMDNTSVCERVTACNKIKEDDINPPAETWEIIKKLLQKIPE